MVGVFEGVFEKGYDGVIGLNTKVGTDHQVYFVRK